MPSKKRNQGGAGRGWTVRKTPEALEFFKRIEAWLAKGFGEESDISTVWRKILKGTAHQIEKGMTVREFMGLKD